ncbi:hypothetical protein BX600DRAFT_259998 [Xylariales sp. PMI_506]|nr:hypothetical protein BX600DRAFT_259998 [Xylariales sp. PMI_506]
MTRPQIIRADSIDLQDHDAPSAKEHKHPTAKSNNQLLGPHQAETLREVAAETKEDRRLSWTNGDIGGEGQQYADEKMQPQDPLAVAQNGGSAASDDGDLDVDDGDLDDDDMMDKISSSPSIEDDAEDIDFEFVYALHTFVATVEGQANATKGDTMVLLDDSNSYWWLVRVVKDSSIGYLPAEHIETPTERLARLNKHRNIDLSQTMLGDTADKPKNGIKGAMRRRKKTVAFAAPTYVDYSDIDYSTEEEDADGDMQNQQQAAQQKQQQSQQQASQQQQQSAPADQAGTDEIEEDESAKVEPLKPRGLQKQAKPETTKSQEKQGDGIAANDAGRNSEEIFDNRSEPRARTTRNGTVRNTDSFFRDETVETKKITLTPNLLRDDNEPRGSSDSLLRQRPSFDKLEKELSADKGKDKKKDKKAGGLRGFFSRKDKKKSSVDEDDDSFGKTSMDATFEAPVEEIQPQAAVVATPATAAPTAAAAAAAMEMDSPPDKSAPQRNPSKLQKQQPRTEPSPTRRPGSSKESKPGMDLAQFLNADSKQKDATTIPPAASLRLVESDPVDTVERPQQREEKSILSKVLHPNEGRPPKVSAAKSRVELDDFDSSDDADAMIPEPTRAAPTPDLVKPTAEEKQLRPTLPGAYPDSYQTTASQQSTQPTNGMVHPAERLSESPVQVSPVHSSPNPPALIGDTSSQEDRSSPISSPSPELVDGSTRGHQNQDSMTSTSGTTTSTWNDNSLRAFFDSGSEIRDLLTVVYDKSDVPPAGPDHPIAGTLFREQNAKLAEITTQLDNMLGDWLARKQRLRGTV